MKTVQKKSLPEFLKKYFWGADFIGLDAAAYPYLLLKGFWDMATSKR